MDVSLWFSLDASSWKMMIYNVCLSYRCQTMLFCFILSLKCPCVKLDVFWIHATLFPVILPTFLYTQTQTHTHVHTQAHTHKHFLWLQKWEPLKKRSLGQNTRPVGLCTFSGHTYTHTCFLFLCFADCSFKWLPVSCFSRTRCTAH